MSKESYKIIIIGGGIAGMSAAHELAERNFEVEVYEKQPIYVGGKARSVEVPNSAVGNRKNLPGEHGFRFFPGFYRHIIDIMERIPFKNGNSVADNLVATEHTLMARLDKKAIVSATNFPQSFEDFKLLFSFIFSEETGLTNDERLFMIGKLWQFLTTCKERRKEEYERISWWQFTEANSKSKAFRQFFVEGLTRTLVAAKAEEMSLRTGVSILLQLMLLALNPLAKVDRILNAPTNEAWLYPWHEYLTKNLGVKYHKGYKATFIHCKNRQIQGVDVIDEQGNLKTVKGDYYIFCLPVDIMATLINEDIIESDCKLGYIKELAKSVEWMTGLQFYLNEAVTVTRGHVLYTDSPWALTSISQLQFWNDFDISKYGNGEVKEILSVDLSDWNTIGLNGKKAKDCTKEEIIEEVWNQLKRSLNVDGKIILTDEMRVAYYMDNNIEFPEPNKPYNTEPLLVNKINTWALRPEAHTNIQNMLLASDYVRTNTDLATMESANEAARRAVNTIITKTKVKKPYCQIWDLEEPLWLEPFKLIDHIRFNKGLPWQDPMHLTTVFDCLNKFRLFK